MTDARSGFRLLVIGSRDLSDAACRALPAFNVDSTTSPLDGVWRVANEPFDAVLLSLSQGERVPNAIRTLREVAPEARIVLSCPPADESLTRAFLDRGADDYVLEPLVREEVEAAFRSFAQLELPDVDRPEAPDSVATVAEFPQVRAESKPQRTTPCDADFQSAPGGNQLPDASIDPSLREISTLADIMKRLADGAAATLARLADWVLHAFDARGARIDVDGRSASAGCMDRVHALEPIQRDGVLVGELAFSFDNADPTRNLSRKLSQYAALIDAVMRQVGDQDRWRQLAESDELSGLANRRFFDHRLDELVADAMRRRARLTLFVFDIDNFKAYNDRHGHATGDALIREIGMLMRRCTRDGDVAARIGGDEFAALFCDFEKQRVPGSQHPIDPVRLAERFCAAIAAHDFRCLGRNAPGPVTISGGLATLPWDGRDSRELLDSADRALLSAKQSGKNRIMLAGERSDSPEPPRPTFQ